MRQLTLHEPGRVGWTPGAVPRLDDPRAALVRPVAASTCDFDHLVYAGTMPFPTPFTLGHEAVAVVEQVGAAVQGVVPGELVVVPFQVSCGTCSRCRAGLTSACSSVSWLSCYGLGDLAGGYGGLVSDLVSVPFADAMLVPLPDQVRAVSAAAVSCNMVDAYRCVAPQLAARPSSNVLVVGGAFANIALYSVRIAQQLGGGRVAFFADDDNQRARAAALGVEVLEALDCDGEEFEITVDASMDARLLDCAVRATARGGTLTISTMYTDPAIRLPLMAAFERCLSVATGQPHARTLVDPVLALLADGRLSLDEVTTDVADWDDAPDAWSAGAGKTVVVRD